MNESWHTYECVCECSWISHGTQLTTSHLKYTRHIWSTHITSEVHTSHLKYTATSHNLQQRGRITATMSTYEWVMTDIWKSHFWHTSASYHKTMNESWHTHEWVMAHTWMSHGTHKWVLADIWKSHFWHTSASHHKTMCVIWLIYVCAMTHLCVWHDSRHFWHTSASHHKTHNNGAGQSPPSCLSHPVKNRRYTNQS